MTTQRALLTDREREILSGEREVKDNYRYSVESRVRARIRERLTEDVEVLEGHDEEFDGELVELLQDVVCPEE
jgi:hypothetical protein